MADFGWCFGAKDNSRLSDPSSVNGALQPVAEQGGEFDSSHQEGDSSVHAIGGIAKEDLVLLR
jgi:hypothetical protein